MAPHHAREFKFAERTLRKMVAESNFFPEAAERDDWFGPADRRIDDDGDGEGSDEVDEVDRTARTR